jgi:hypothetical protein
MNSPYYLDVFAGDVFWTSPVAKKVMSQDIFGRADNVTHLSNQFSLYDLKVYSTLKAPGEHFTNLALHFECVDGCRGYHQPVRSDLLQQFVFAVRCRRRLRLSR